MSFRVPFRTAFGVGAGTSTLVPEVWDVAINGRTFMFEDKYFGTERFRRSSIDLLSPRAVQGSVNEDSLNPADGLVARVKSWHHGAGQEFLDRETSDPYRFRSSRGIDVWTQGKLSLLPDVEQVADDFEYHPLAAETYFGARSMLAAGGRIYAQSGSLAVAFTSDLQSWTSVTGLPSGFSDELGGMATDGYRVWMAFAGAGGDGIYETTIVSSSASQRTTAGVALTVIDYVKGRLMVADLDGAIYNVVDLSGAAVALPSALFTPAQPDFAWVGFAEGPNNIYAAGYVGDKSTIYRTAVKPDGTSLDVPVVAATLPDGEIVYRISSYLGLILIGTGTGWWVGQPDSNGDLALNKVQTTASPVRCFEGQGDFIWYGWPDFDTDTCGLGRADLRTDTKGASVVTPGYASDLMRTQTAGVGDVTLEVVTFGAERVFATAGALGADGSIWAESDDLVSSGFIDLGQISFGFTDPKTTVNALVNHEPLQGTVAVQVTTADGVTATAGTSTTEGSTSQLLSTGMLRSEAFDVTLTFTRDADDDTAGPVVTRLTLESNLTPGRGEYFNDAYRIWDQVELVNGASGTQDTGSLIRTLLGYYGTPVTRQDAYGSETVTLEAHDFIIEDRNAKRDGYQGTFFANWRRGKRRD